MRKGFAATTALAVVAAIATSAWLCVLLLASYEAGLSAVSGGQLAISRTPDSPRSVIEQELKGAADATGSSLLLALVRDTPQRSEFTFVRLAGALEDPMSPRVQYDYASEHIAASTDFRGFYATDATGRQLEDLVELLQDRGFSAEIVRESLADHLLFYVTEPGIALLVLGVAVLVLQAFAADAARHREASFVRATVGWSRRRDAAVELQGLTVAVVVVVIVVASACVVLWGCIGGFRRPALVLPPAVVLIGGTSLALLGVRTAFFLRRPGPSPARSQLSQSPASRPGSYRAGMHVALTALVIIGVVCTGSAVQATRRAVEAVVLLEPYADWQVMRVGIAGALDEGFAAALGQVTRAQIAAGTALLRDTSTLPETLVVAWSASEEDGSQANEAELWARHAPEAEELRVTSFLLVTDVRAPGAPVTPPTDPALTFDVHEVDDPARAAGVREVALLPEVVPFDVVVRVPLDLLPDDVLSTAAGNGQVLFESSDPVDVALAERDADGFVMAWDSVGDRVVLVLAQCRREALVTAIAALLALTLLLVSTVRAGLEHVRSGRHEGLLLRSVGRTSWHLDRRPVVRRTALTAGAAVGVVPLLTLLGGTSPVGAAVTGTGVTAAELVVFTTTVALVRRRMRRREVRDGHAL